MKKFRNDSKVASGHDECHGDPAMLSGDGDDAAIPPWRMCHAWNDPGWYTQSGDDDDDDDDTSSDEEEESTFHPRIVKGGHEWD